MKEISFKELSLNPMTSVTQDWWLISAGSEERGYNGMTASWGHLGGIWGRPGANAHGLPTVIVYVRPQRYTHDFMDREEVFSVCMFSEDYRRALAYMGTRSGRDEDKFAACGLTPAFDSGTVYAAEADTVLICRKIYKAPLREEYFVDRGVMEACYPERDFHDLYVGEIIKVLVKEQ